jgi:tRNA G18 (ribose-2'-O)-methylase SpoU
MNVVILENIRSAYNVGNIIRTADALGWQVRLTGYSPSPMDNKKVVKTSLGAEETVGLRQFGFTQEAIDEAKKLGFRVFAAEITDTAISLDRCEANQPIALVFGNEVD